MSDSILPTNTDTCLVEFDKKEYAIVGDLFFAKTLEEVPPWFLDLVKDTVVSINGSTYDALAQYNLSLLAALQSIEVSKNTYEQYINKLITDEAAFISVLETLNSIINENDATIRRLLLTYATEDFAVSSAAQLLTASLNGGAIGAKIGSVESAMATQYGAMAQRLQTLESTFDDVSGQQSANASAIQALTTYTGYGVYNGADALIANSSFKTDLDAYLEGTDYNIGGSSTLLQDVTAVSTEKMKQVEAKFEYGSTIELDGKQYNAGFGLVQTGTLLPDGTTYDSEFWIRASKFKFIADDGVTTSTPFQVDGNVVKIGWGAVTGSAKPQDGATRNVNRGTWDSGVAYVVGDIVQHNGSSYTNKIATSSVNPTDTSYWTLLASQGPAGAPGATGPQGPTGGRGTAIGYGTSVTNSAFTASTGLSPIYGDQLIVTNSNDGTIIYTYNGSSWANSTALQIRGDAVIDGTLSVTKIAGGSVDTGMEFRLNYLAGIYKAAVYGSGTADNRALGVGGRGVYGVAGYTEASDGAGVMAGYSYLSDNYLTNAAFLSTAQFSGDFRHTLRAGYQVGSSGLGGSNIAYLGHIFYAGEFLGNVRITGSTLAFTGAHSGFFPIRENWEQGDILIDTGSGYKVDFNNYNSYVSISNAPYAPNVVGVLVRLGNDSVASTVSMQNDVDYYYVEEFDQDTYIGCMFNAVGEGYVNVCGLNGNLAPGDLITTSSIPGKGMKQVDDVVRSYTVGKCREYVTFDYPEQVKQVACIYMCG